ncbi:MAG TPA: HNH endonuclease signature motif containing protein [Mycobacterium sp.]|nr:HNH endonuclease signature motif containing protein [Mycobacterium sp.]HPZ94956.1 HNH endonuclease signature motif containing protein [Mycobacterium sp.]HQE16410.1 HNH endonuclease signature motif containing protein [Mycobacterium sp.]
MFDTRLGGLTEAEVLAEMASAQRAERTAVARRLFAAGRLCQLRMSGVTEDQRLNWCIDNWEAVAAEVGAELGISRRRASVQMEHGLALLERLPKLGAALAAGDVEFRVVAVALYRTALITDPDLLATIDTALARNAPGWNALPQRRIAECIDWRVRELDPAAERVARQSKTDRHIEIGPGRDGLAAIWGSVQAPDAAALDRRLDQLAATVCPGDSRTRQQRRADALSALTAGATALRCDCGSPNCPAADTTAEPGQIVIHLIAEADTVSGRGESPGYLPGYGHLPADDVRELASRATIRQLVRPEQLRAEPGYRPSRALAEFIRHRDLTCRFPGCDVPAEFCDIDHSVPRSRGGATHPSNLSLRCRPHHLLKTFWAGADGWREKLHPDGTMEWISPAGRRYTTTPGGVIFFPQLAAPAGHIDPGPTGSAPEHDEGDSPCRGLMMPLRRRTRAEERSARIAWERGLNEARWAADPPPF